MSIQSVISPNMRPPLAVTPQLSAINSGSTNSPAKVANQPHQPRGVEVLQRELESRGVTMKGPRQSSAKLLDRLSTAIKPTHVPSDHEARPHRTSTNKLVQAAIPTGVSATIQKPDASPSSPSKVSLSDVKDALASINVSTLTETGEPMTQEWIDKQLKTIDAQGIQPLQQSSSPPMYQITIDGLLANWGKSDSIYDLTGSGTVDSEDLLLLLSNGGTMLVEAPAGTEPQLTLDGLLAAWGQPDSPYDFTGNGTVDSSDLLYFLQWMMGNN